jgi:hypothetical protein
VTPLVAWITTIIGIAVQDGDVSDYHLFHLENVELHRSWQYKG